MRPMAAGELARLRGVITGTLGAASGIPGAVNLVLKRGGEEQPSQPVRLQWLGEDENDLGVLADFNRRLVRIIGDEHLDIRVNDTFRLDGRTYKVTQPVTPNAGNPIMRSAIAEMQA